MSTTISKEMKESSYIKLPNLYQNLELLALIDNLFYKAYGSLDEYDFTSNSIETRQEEDASYYIDVVDLCYLEDEGHILLDNIEVHVYPLSNYELHEFSHKRNNPLKIYQMSIEQLKRALFITEHMNIPLSQLINIMFLENQLPHVKTIKNLRYPFIGLSNEYSKWITKLWNNSIT